MFTSRPLYVLLIAGCLSIPVMASPDSISLRVISGDHNQPYNFEQDGEARGLSVEIAKEMLRRAKLDAKIELFPWPRAFALCKATPNTLLLTTARTPEREKLFHWIGPIAKREVWLWKLSNREDISVNSLAQASKYVVATTIGDASVSTLLKNGFVVGKNLDLSSNSQGILRKMEVGRVDLVPISLQSSGLREGEVPGQILEKVTLVTREGGNFMAVNLQSDPALVKLLEPAFNSIVSDKTLQTLAARWQYSESRSARK